MRAPAATIPDSGAQPHADDAPRHAGDAHLERSRGGPRERVIADRAFAIQRDTYFQRHSVPRDASKAQIEQSFLTLTGIWDSSTLPADRIEARANCGEDPRRAPRGGAKTLLDPKKRLEYEREAWCSA